MPVPPNWAVSRMSQWPLRGTASFENCSTRAVDTESNACRRPKRKAAFTLRPPRSPCLPEPEDVEIDIKPDDYRKDIFHASGPGGPAREQDRFGRPLDALRIGHRRFHAGRKEPTQESGQSPAGPQIQTLRLYQQQEHEKRASERKSLVGSGDRSQRIRTYNFPENRVTDHRINLTLYKLDQIIAGMLEPISQALIDHDRDEMRRGMEDLD